MRSMKKVLWSLLIGVTLLSSAPVYGDDVEDDAVPDVTARVSRISFIRGDVRIKRDGSQDWEKAVLNLPIVEGDELTTDAGGRVEIQLNSYSHIRLSENSYLKMVGLKDGAVALSLSEGTMSITLTRFDKDSAFFEVDAPKTTIAIQKSGMYRIDAGRAGVEEVRVTAANDGEARVYADNSGFTLKNGRTATLKIDGPLAGEWETNDASRFADEFDAWALDRDVIIAKRIRDAFYDKYYDRDIYGAEDLNDHGEWVHTRKYGYVWRPYRTATSQYANWSPYRYGHWRWVPPYGWTWVNDEPWGWATYHHGRWFYDDGYWYWTPYGYTRRGRSWWFPALIGVTIIQHNVYWYPLPHDYGYFNYNHCFGGWGGPRGPRGPRGNHHGNNNVPGGPVGPVGPVGPGPTPTPPGYVGPLAGQVGPSVFVNNDSRRKWFSTPPLLRVPPGGVVSAPLSSFGREKEGFGTPTTGEAQAVLKRALSDNKPGRILPTFDELDGRVSTAIKSEKPRNIISNTKPMGAAIRNADGGPMDQVLQNTKIRGNRDPIRPASASGDGGMPTRKTGAVTRDPIRVASDDPIRPDSTVRNTKQREERDDPIRVAPPPREVKQSKPREDRDSEPIRVAPPPREENRKQRNDPIRPERSEPVRSEPVRSEPVRSEPPPRSEPVRSQPPPPRSEPTKSEPSKQNAPDRKGKDG